MCAFDEFGCDPDLTLTQTMVAGSAAGMSEHLVMFPIDTIKTRIMSQHVGYRYHGTLSTGRTILQQEGLAALYKGFFPAFCAAIPAHAGLFTTYEYVKQALSTAQVSTQAACVVGAVCATIVHDTLTVPFDVVKNRMQEGEHLCANARQCFLNIARGEGLVAFARPLPLHWLMNIPHSAVQWLTYETLKVMTGRDIHEQIAMDYFLCGAVAGINASFVSTPLDLIRTRLQLGCDTYTSTVRNIYVQDGIRGFWRLYSTAGCPDQYGVGDAGEDFIDLFLAYRVHRSLS